jgi:mono/diheme cytochrome c family protein
MMKKNWIICGCAALVMVMVSCNNIRRSPGRVYMPDMSYSRAYETYASVEALQQQGVNYKAMPVAGTFAREDSLFIYPYKNDSTGYANSKNVTNPLPALDAKQFMETARLYLINCGICHGEKLDGNGPLYNGGNGPFPAAPRNLLSDPLILAMSEGTMFHSLTYGKNTMGSYASQLTTEQRWMIIHYIKEKQASNAAGAVKTPAADSTGKKM